MKFDPPELKLRNKNIYFLVSFRGPEWHIIHFTLISQNISEKCPWNQNFDNFCCFELWFWQHLSFIVFSDYERKKMWQAQGEEPLKSFFESFVLKVDRHIDRKSHKVVWHFKQWISFNQIRLGYLFLLINNIISISSPFRLRVCNNKQNNLLSYGSHCFFGKVLLLWLKKDCNMFKCYTTNILVWIKLEVCDI